MMSGILSGARRVLWAVILLSYLPLLWPHIQRLWSSEHYRYFPFLIAALAGIVLMRLRSRPGEPAAASKCTTVAQSLWLLAAWFTLLAAVLLWSAWMAAVSAVLAARAVLLHLGAHKGDKLLGAWLLLWLLVPLPLRFDARLNSWLHELAVSWGGHILDYFRVPHLATGQSIQTPGHVLGIQEACGGIEAALVLLMATALFLLWVRRPVIHSLLLLFSTLYWAIAVNAVRMTIVVYAAMRSQTNLTSGWADWALNAALYSIGFVLVFCTDRLLMFVSAPSPDPESEEWEEELESSVPEVAIQPVPSAVTEESALTVLGRRLTLSLLAVMFSALGAIQAIALSCRCW